MGVEETETLFPSDTKQVAKKLGKERTLACLEKMLECRNFELRAEAAYQQGKVGGFLHLYIGQEAIQTALIGAIGVDHWFIASYRCHALALLLGETPESLMKELYGKADGNTFGRGGSMHMYSKRMLGGFAIVGGQIAIGTGAAFSLKYLNKKGEIAVTFFGDGAMAQGSFHESMNLASLLSVPCMYVLENNKWSMGTPLYRTIANHEHFPRMAAAAYDIKYMRLDGMDLFNCYAGFQEAYSHIQSTGRPILVECMTERFRGHSISDPALYRSKEELKACMERDPILLLKNFAMAQGWLTAEEYKALDKKCRDSILAAVKAAEEDPWPDVASLESGVYAKGDE
jgi:pyruvate dehydrogenase E1 component alpha subunit